MNNIQKYVDLIAKKLSGNASTPEVEALRTWRKQAPENEQLFQETQELWQLSKDYVDAPLEVDNQAAWQKIEAATSNSITSKTVSKSKWGLWAIVLLLGSLGAYFFWNEEDKSNEEQEIPTENTTIPIAYQTKAGEKVELTLPDGSQVWLNEQSSLEFIAEFQTRKVNLKGEAFFDIQRDEVRPFEIHTGYAKTRVLGTSFNVRAYPEEEKVEVTVETGKVQLLGINGDQKMELTRGLSGAYDKLTHEVQEKTVSNALAWREERLAFDNTPMPQVEEALERYFGVDLALAPNIAKCDFNGTFEEPALQDILEILAFSMELEIDSTAAGYELRGEGCF